MTRPGNGPYKATLADGMYKLSIRISPRIEQMMEARLVRDNKNRTDWVREAIVEKLARDGKK